MAITTNPRLKQAFITPKAVTANKTLTGTDSGTAWTNTNASASITFTLPKAAVGLTAVVSGLQYYFLVNSAHNIVIAPLTGDTIRGLATSASLTLTTVGQTVTLTCLVAGFWEQSLSSNISGPATLTGPVTINSPLITGVASLTVNLPTDASSTGLGVSLVAPGSNPAILSFSTNSGAGFWSIRTNFSTLNDLNIYNGATQVLNIANTGAISVAAPSSGSTLTINGLSSAAGVIFTSASNGYIEIKDATVQGFIQSAGTIPDFRLGTLTSHTVTIAPNAVPQFQVAVGGAIKFLGVATTAVAPGAGGAGALPATPAGYATFTIGATARQIPYY